MATVANNIVLNEGDEILVIDEQFPSNIILGKSLLKNITLKYSNCKLLKL